MGSFIPGQDAAVDRTAAAPLPPRDVLLSVRTGKSRRFGSAGFRTAINKQAREGKLSVATLGIAGDEQTYEFHGGPDKALHQYCSSHYEAWNEELPGRAHLFKIGGFGENLSTAHMSEANVCVGDVYRIGAALTVQVSQPRQPCYKLNHRFEHRKASALAQSSGRTGWYLRVLAPGPIEQGDEMALVERVNPGWPLARVQNYLYHDRDNLAAMAELVELPALAEEMRNVFKDRLSHGTEDMSGRLDDQAPVAWRSCRLVAKIPLTSRISRFIFESQDDHENASDNQLARFQHVRLRFGPELGFTRAYSVVCGDMARFELGIAGDDNSRGGSAYLHEEMAVGATVKVAKGHAPPGGIPVATDDGPSGVSKHVFIIGGIGVTAFLTEIQRLSSSANASLEVHYAVRSLADAAYLDQLPADCTTVYASSESRRLDVSRAIPAYVHGTPGCAVYCCGPSSLLESCRDLTRRLDYPADRTHFEEFAASSAMGTGDAFEVEIQSTRQVLQVPREKSLLGVLLDAGFDIDSSCLVGNCGTCMVDYCKGEVSHRGTALGEEQKTSAMLACVSRGKGRVVVDC